MSDHITVLNVLCLCTVKVKLLRKTIPVSVNVIYIDHKVYHCLSSKSAGMKRRAILLGRDRQNSMPYFSLSGREQRPEKNFGIHREEYAGLTRQGKHKLPC